ncbi:MAG: DUF2092 domain-containing protein [Candidatus Binatia bacterium]
MNYVRWRNVSAMGLALWLTTAPGYAQESGATTGRIEEKAMATLMRVAETLAKAQRFSVNTDIEYDVMQDWGQKLEFGASRTIIVKRPDRMSVDIVDRDGTKRGFRFDGKQIAFFGLDEKVYATVDKSGDLDAALTYFTRDLQMPLPMVELWSNNLPKTLKDRVSEAYVIAEETVRGTLCDHIAVRNDMTDAQVWITKGDQPLLHRFVITYKHANGQPEFRADFLDWNLSAEAPDSVFAFTPAEGANRIQFVAGMDPDAGKK